jgi:hypothetical protein
VTRANVWVGFGLLALGLALMISDGAPRWAFGALICVQGMLAPISSAR